MISIVRAQLFCQFTLTNKHAYTSSSLHQFKEKIIEQKNLVCKAFIYKAYRPAVKV